MSLCIAVNFAFSAVEISELNSAAAFWVVIVLEILSYRSAPTRNPLRWTPSTNMACALFAVIFSPGLHLKQITLLVNRLFISFQIVSSLFDIVIRSLSLKCFVSKFLLKVL